MTFEEFFKKKKIDLAQLKQAEPNLFAEFELHYAQMGEKSFDHTKKYWFNTLRRKYHTADEPKVEKVKMDNPLAEQTITASIPEQPQVVTAPNLGFKPKFKTPPATLSTPVEQHSALVEQKTDTASPTEEKPKLGFKPKFKTAVAKPADETPVPDTKPESEPSSPEAEVTEVKAAYKPKFQMRNFKPKTDGE